MINVLMSSACEDGCDLLLPSANLSIFLLFIHLRAIDTIKQRTCLVLPLPVTGALLCGTDPDAKGTYTNLHDDGATFRSQTLICTPFALTGL